MDGTFQLASYANPEVDELLVRVNRKTDRDAARPLWHRLQRILVDEQPWTFLYYVTDLILVAATAGAEAQAAGIISAGIPGTKAKAEAAILVSERADGSPILAVKSPTISTAVWPSS
jgi:ABC-type transport system substrate-binding protein